MTNCKDCNRTAGKMCCSDPGAILSRYQVDGSPQRTFFAYCSRWHGKSNSKMDMFPGNTSTVKKFFSLPREYFVHHVYAKSETVEVKYQPAASSFIGASQAPSLSSSFTVPSSVTPSTSSTHTALSTSSSTVSTVAYIDDVVKSDLKLQNPDLKFIITSEQNQNPIHFQRHRHEGEFLCGWGAAFINICITFPINKTMFRQQLHGISGLRAINQLRKDGPRFLYRGLLPPLLQKSSSLSVMFGMYYKCQDILHANIPNMNVYVNHALAALGAGTIEALFTPFERIQALMQTRVYHNKFSNTLDAFYNLRSYGLREYYRGFSAIVLRNGPSNIAFFLGREHLQHFGPQSNSYGQKVALDFLSGACLGAVISTCFFPLNVVKIRMQCVLGGDFSGIWATLKTVVAERNGLSGLYKGIHLNYMRSFVSWGIINASYELLMKTFFVQDY